MMGVCQVAVVKKQWYLALSTSVTNGLPESKGALNLMYMFILSTQATWLLCYIGPEMHLNDSELHFITFECPRSDLMTSCIK